MTKILLLALTLSSPLYAQDGTPVAEEVTVDPLAEIEETPDPAASAPADTGDEPVAATPADVAPTGPARGEQATTDLAPPAVEERTPETVATEVSPATAPAKAAATSERAWDDEERRFNPYESHWLTTFGFETLKYEVPYEFVGEKKNFTPGDQEMWGGRLGIGGELYLGLGLVTTTRLEGFYVGTLFSRVLNAGPQDGDEEFAYTKRTGNVWGVEATQSLGYVFDFKTKNPIMDEWAYLTVEPFVEAGVGKAYAYNRLNYDYDTGTTTNEGYRQRVRDDLTTAKFGGGVNFTASSGYFLYLKATVTTFDVSQRKVQTYTRPDQGAGSTVRETQKDVKLDPITIYALGGGYKF
jgi:hypothetical protein